jgi:twitching motility protein PilT
MSKAVRYKIDRFLMLMQDRGASDLHMSVGRPPMFRQSGQMDPIRYRVLTNKDWVEFMKPIAGPENWAKFKKAGDCDFAHAVPGVARFRVNFFMQDRGYAAVFRIIPTKLMTFAQLGLPKPVEKICHIDRGLVLVTGPTGSGKSTTLSAIINKINEEQSRHIITIEDPIEFVHPNKRSVISQREVHMHTTSFAEAVQAAVREDPDTILVGEMRDL